MKGVYRGAIKNYSHSNASIIFSKWIQTIIILITIPADGTMGTCIYMYLLSWFKRFLCILAINKYNNENKVLYTCNKF